MNRRQMILGTLPAVSALGLIAPTVVANKKKRKTKIVTKTFKSTADITIFNQGTASPYPSTINVSGFKKGKVLDVNLTLVGLSHDSVFDLEVQLAAPGARSALLMRRVGDETDLTNLTLILNDQAPTALPQFVPLTSGAFKPKVFNGVALLPAPAPQFIDGSKLAVFNGINPNGLWRLFINDAINDNAGSISGWELKIKARVDI